MGAESAARRRVPRWARALGAVVVVLVAMVVGGRLDDADTVALQRVAREVRRGTAGPVVLDERAHAAHRAVTARVLARL